MSTVAIKKVDEQLYRKAKALASLKGKTVGEVVNEALGLWVEVTSRGTSIEDWIKLEEEGKKDNEVYQRMAQKLIAEHPHEYVVIAEGRVIGAFKAARAAYLAVKKANPTHAIVTRIEGKETPKFVQLGWSLMEQFR